WCLPAAAGPGPGHRPPARVPGAAGPGPRGVQGRPRGIDRLRRRRPVPGRQPLGGERVGVLGPRGAGGKSISARRWSLVAAGLWVLTCPARAADWPQWRGPHRDGVSAEIGLLKGWRKIGPPLLWTFDNAGVGYSGPAVVGGRLYLLGGRSGDEHV